MEKPQRLIALMDITKTSNKELANYLHVDPSMISQVRTGRRKAPEKSNYKYNTARYFSTQFRKESQFQELSEIMGIDRDKINGDPESIFDIIYDWLCEEDTINENIHTEENNEVIEDNLRLNRIIVDCSARERIEMMYDLYNHFLKIEKPTTIYFLTNENSEWYACDEKFSKQVISWTQQLIQKGHTIVQLLNQNTTSYYEEIALWLPGYLTGKVKIYYYPRYIDFPICNTVVFIEGDILYTSSSKDRHCYCARISTSKTENRVYANQIKDFMKSCREASRYHCKTKDLMNCYSYYLGTSSDRISICSGLSFESIPYTEFIEYFENEGNHTVLDILRGHFNNEYCANNEIYEICELANVSDLLDGKVRIYIPGLSCSEELYYTPELYLLHIKNIINMLKTNEKYNFYCYKFNLENIELDVYGERGATLAKKTDTSSMVEFISTDVIGSINAHAYRTMQRIPRHLKERKAIIRKLEELVIEIEESIL